MINKKTLIPGYSRSINFEDLDCCGSNFMKKVLEATLRLSAEPRISLAVNRLGSEKVPGFCMCGQKSKAPVNVE